MPKDPKKTSKERLSKRQSQYGKLYDSHRMIDEEDVFDQEKKNFGLAMHPLILMLEELGPYTKKGSLKNPQDKKGKIISMEDMIKLQNYYKNVMNKLNELTDAMHTVLEADEKKLNTINDINLYQSTASDIVETKSEIEYYDLVGRILSKDLNAINNIIDKKIETNLYDVFETSRINSEYTAELKDAGDKNKGNQNERIAVTLTDKNGNKKYGFFTPDNKQKKPNVVLIAIRNAKKKYGKSADFLNYEKLMQAYEILRTQKKKGISKIMNNRESLSTSGYKNAYEEIVKVGGDAIKSFINTPEKLQIFVDVASDAFMAQNQQNIQNEVNINPKANINRRNAAMSRMAEILGCPDVLAESENVKINLNGKPIKGTFMENAIGEDVNKFKEDGLMLKSGLESINELSLKKQLANLQILDFICGNPDRHAGNMMYHYVIKDGKVVMDKIQGIDNDTCLGKTPLDEIGMREVSIYDLKVITREMANKILTLDKDSLREMLYGYDISSGEMRNMLKRVDQLKAKIHKDQLKYDDTFKKGYIIPNTVKIVDDEELSEMSIKDDLAMHVNYNSPERQPCNIFNNIADNYSGASNVKHYAGQLERKYRKELYDFKIGALDSLTNILNDIEKDTGWGRSSQGYDDMQDSLEKLKKSMIEASSEQEIMDLEKKIQESMGVIDVYMDYKINKKESWMFNKEPHKAGRTERRFNHALKAKHLLEKHINKLNDVASAKNMVTDFKDKKEALITLNKEKEKSYIKSPEYVEYENKRKANLYNNHLSRCLVSVKGFADQIKEENLNILKNANRKPLLKMQFDLGLGFSLMSIQGGDRPDFIRSIEEQMGKKITLSEDELMKRSIAAHLVITKYNLNYRENNSKLNPPKSKPLNELEKKVKGYLEHVDISNLDNAVDRLMESPEFKQYHTMYKALYQEKFIGLSGGLTFFNMEMNEQLFKGYPEIVWIIHPELKPKKKLEEIPLKKVNLKNKKNNKKKDTKKTQNTKKAQDTKNNKNTNIKGKKNTNDKSVKKSEKGLA